MSTTSTRPESLKQTENSDHRDQPLPLLPADEYNLTLAANAHPRDWQNPVPAPIYNLVVIGGGSAGLMAAAVGAGLGAKVAVIERHLLGGDCLNTGCVPSKAVIRSAKLMGDLALAAELGITIPAGVETDFAAVMTRMRRIRAEISHHDSARRFADLGVEVFFGEGRFTGPNTISVAGATLKFKKAVVATGSRPMTLPIDGLAEAGYLTNETFFSLTERPKRIAVIGAGPIGSELAQALQRLGSQVTVFDLLPQVLGREDREAAAMVERALRRDGVEFFLAARLQQVSRDGAAKMIHFEQQGQAQTVVVDEILVAAGRTPNLEGLNLEKAGIIYNKQGIEVNDHLQTTNPNVYAAGDVGLKYQFTHTADASARLILRNALFMGRNKVSALTIPWCTYTDPEVAHVGLYPADAEQAGFDIDTFVQHFDRVDRAITDGETDGFVKIHVKKGTDQIVGATIVGRHAGEMISEITTAMVGGVGLKTLSSIIHPYPTQAEAIRKVADSYNRTRLTPTFQNLFSGWFALQRAIEPDSLPEKLISAVRRETRSSAWLVALVSTAAWVLWLFRRAKTR